MNGIGIWLVILTICSFARDYYISFDYVVKNSELKVSHFNCSKALSKTKLKKTFLFSLPLYKNIKSTCYKYKNQIVDRLLKEEVILSSYDKKERFFFFDKTKLVFLPRRFDIIIKSNRVFFYVKEED